MSCTLIIPGRLPSLNEYITACKRAWFIGESFKKKHVRRISLWIIANKIPVFQRPITAGFKWYEQDRRRDGDNIRSAEKYIMDALRDLRRIKDDSQRWVRPSMHEILIDRDNPRIEVTIDEDAP